MISLIIVIRKLIFASEAVARRCSVKKGVLRNFTKFTGKHLCQSLFFNKVAGVTLVTLLKKRLWHRCFPVNVVKFLRTPFLHNTSGRRCSVNINIRLHPTVFATFERVYDDFVNSGCCRIKGILT